MLAPHKGPKYSKSFYGGGRHTSNLMHARSVHLQIARRRGLSWRQPLAAGPRAENMRMWPIAPQFAIARKYQWPRNCRHAGIFAEGSLSDMHRRLREHLSGLQRNGACAPISAHFSFFSPCSSSPLARAPVPSSCFVIVAAEKRHAINRHQ